MDSVVATIQRWWKRMGALLYPGARRLLITPDSGGSNSRRNRLWKLDVQRLANELGLAISVCHVPPGTGKRNRIEDRMSCHIARSSRGKPLVCREAIVNLIAATTTRAGLSIRSDIDATEYVTGIKVTDDRMNALSISRTGFHDEWNFTFVSRHWLDTFLARLPSSDLARSP